MSHKDKCAICGTRGESRFHLPFICKDLGVIQGEYIHPRCAIKLKEQQQRKLQRTGGYLKMLNIDIKGNK